MIPHRVMSEDADRTGGRLLVLVVLVVALVALLDSPASAEDSWTYEYGDPSPDSYSSANAVAVAADGSVYVVGTYFGRFEGYTPVDQFDTFVMKLSPGGEVDWVNSWDPADGPDDLSQIGLFGYPPWLHSPRWGSVVIDGAGNVFVSMNSSFAVFEPDGRLLASSDSVDLGDRVVAQTDSDGGVLVLEAGSRITAIDSRLAVQWTRSIDYATRGRGALIALDDGGAVLVADEIPPLSFQSVRQVVERLDAEGATVWSVAYNGRCSAYDPVDSQGTGPAFLSGDEIVVLSVEVGLTCQVSDEARVMASYSLATGEWLGDRDLVPTQDTEPRADDDYTLFACLPSSEIPAVITDWQGTDWCPAGTVRMVELEAPYPRMSRDGSSAFSLALLNTRVGSYQAVLASFVTSSTAFELVGTLGLADSTGIDILGIDATGNGAPVLVGRSDGSAALSAATAAALLATDQPHAIVVFNPKAPPPPPPDSFVDDDESVFETDIEWMAAAGITMGCNPPVNDRFCPGGVVTRGQMAAFLVRALKLTAHMDDPFADDDGSIFEGDIERLAAAGITMGCNPPVNDRFCPDGKVTREQMAAFLVRALGYTDNGGGDLFTDDDDSIFEADIDRLGTAGVTKGCNPPTNDRFCPKGNVTRGQMAAFLHRALG